MGIIRHWGNTGTGETSRDVSMSGNHEKEEHGDGRAIRWGSAERRHIEMNQISRSDMTE